MSEPRANERTRRTYTPGLSPGVLPAGATDQKGHCTVEVIDYNTASVARSTVTRIAADVSTPPADTVRWVRISGMPSTTILAAVGEAFGVHPLVLEDIASANERVKNESYEGYSYTVLHTWNQTDGGEFREFTLDVLLTARVLITVHDADTDTFFAPILTRLQNAGSLLRHGAVDILYYAVVDLAVDWFFPIVARYEDKIEDLEDAISMRPDPARNTAIHHLRTEIQQLRSTLWATRDVTAEIARTDGRGLSAQTLLYFRDAHDHVMHLLDSVTNLRDSAVALRELQMSAMGNRMNEVMKVLTIISTVFIPITFISGIYGMNFAHMPELGLRWAYPAVLALMGIIVGGMIMFFKRRKWF